MVAYKLNRSFHVRIFGGGIRLEAENGRFPIGMRLSGGSRYFTFLLKQSQDCLFQISVFERFQKIIADTKAKSALRVFEITVGGENDKTGAAAGLAQFCNHFYTVHARHFDIGDNDIGGETADQVNAFLSVCCFSGHHTV